MNYALCIMHSSKFPHGGQRPDGPRRAKASRTVAVAENVDNVDNDGNDSPSLGKSTMTSCHNPGGPFVLRVSRMRL